MAGFSQSVVRPRGLLAAALVVAVQLVAAIYFLIDAVFESRSGDRALGLLDVLVGIALIAGVVYGMVAVRRLAARTHRSERALAAARGAMGELIDDRFAGWQLSKAEADVALFALKGCSVSEIAEMRGSSAGTVRSQLSSVYAKAGVTGQPMLLSLFLDDLLEGVGES